MSTREELEAALLGCGPMIAMDVMAWCMSIATGREVEACKALFLATEARFGTGGLRALVPRATVEQLLAEARANPTAVLKSMTGLSSIEDIVRAAAESPLPIEDQQLIASYELRAATGGPAKKLPGLSELIDEGRRWYSLSYMLAKDDARALECLRAKISEIGERESNRARIMKLVLLGNEGHYVIGLARWFDQGCPVIDLHGHTYAAALMATAVGSDADLRAPWKAFFIRVPAGLVDSVNDAGEAGSIVRVLVHVHDSHGRADEVWSFIGMGSNGVLLWSLRHTLAELLETDQLSIGEQHGAFDVPSSKNDERALTVLKRLVLSTCLAMCVPADEGGPRPARSSAASTRDGEEPSCRFFKLGRPVKVDCRPALAAYLSGAKRGSPTVQWLVRGHWRNQAHGPKHSLRRMQWIEPHWSGDPAAPIALRSHKLNQEPGDDQ